MGLPFDEEVAEALPRAKRLLFAERRVCAVVDRRLEPVHCDFGALFRAGIDGLAGPGCQALRDALVSAVPWAITICRLASIAAMEVVLLVEALHLARSAVRHRPPLRALSGVVFGPAIDPFPTNANGAVSELHVLEPAGCARVVDGVHADTEVSGGLPGRHPDRLSPDLLFDDGSHDPSLSASTEVPVRKRVRRCMFNVTVNT